ncbi:sensor histidine kinase [Microbacterium nymphoidis]|uniref:sensor histidine kinase n=1 Tax=Microbacterium nymphoidis TaxID=2898586 RepID=UPI001E6390CF|nr:HAMP domain-containing sensor histidine kinase [Microbacterium nymphoidis]MCD2498159.1 HAMP domain-containing histidine kinase [Microbacterium nymphoidis]
MMVLAPSDVAVIALTSLVCTGVVALMALLLLRLLRRRPLFIQVVVIGVSGVVATVASVIAISVEMYLSEHDLTVLIWVIAIAAALSVVLAWVLTRSLRRSIASVSRDIRQVPAEQPELAEAVGVAELAGLQAELALVAARVRDARTELEELDSARRRFFAWISHDLRTPLAGLQVVAEAAELSPHEDVRALAQSVGAQTLSMTRLVDDLFELSQLSSGQLVLRTQQVDLHDIVSDVVSEMRVAADRRRVRIEARGIGGQTLWADPRGLSRIVSNLVANAVRHAPVGSTILITVTDVDNSLVLGILDEGSGVASTDLDRMFDVGWKQDDARGPDDAADLPQSSGAGLGLSIARGFARAHGGDVTAENTGRGFRMNVELPRQAPGQARERARTQA